MPPTPAIDFNDLNNKLSGLGFKYVNGESLGKIISDILPYIFIISGILLLIYLIYGGLTMMISRGDPKAVQGAQGKITNALIGFSIVIFAYIIVKLVGIILGIDDITNIFK